MLAFCDIFDFKVLVFACLLAFLPNNLANDANEDVVSLTQQNINTTLASNELVFINFYRQGCPFSNLLAPIFEEAATKVRKAFPEAHRVVMAKVDCDRESSIALRFHITKYPTLKFIRNGQPTKREYRGPRSVEAFEELIKKQLEDPIKEFYELKELTKLDHKKRMIIGYFDRKNISEYAMFRKVATNLKDDCQFHAGFGNASQTMHPLGEPIIVFRPDKARSNDEDVTYHGSLNNFDELNVWAQEKCVPVVREITFENADELTEEGLPFLILFHTPDDVESVKTYKDVVTGTLLNEKQNVNFLTADGLKFAHILHHLGKIPADLPLIAIDNFRHKYVFPNFHDIHVEGKLRSFLKDLYSGKLDREFHYVPGPNSNEVQQVTGEIRVTTTMPEPTFQNLAPSENRYSGTGISGRIT